jgi:hypothetical protein
MDEKKAKSVIDQAVGQLGAAKVAEILSSYTKRAASRQRVREFLREAKAAGKL